MKKVLKPLLIALILVSLQGIIYWGVKYIQQNPTVISSSLDALIPFNKYFIYPYILWYLTLFVVPLVLYLSDEMSFNKYLLCTGIALIISFSIFIIFPTIVNRPEITQNDFTSNIVKLIYSIDEPAYNCLPSTHCVICFIFIFASFSNKKLSIFNKCFISAVSILIVLSTLYIKQHALYDVLAALMVSIISWVITEIVVIKKLRSKP